MPALLKFEWVVLSGMWVGLGGVEFAGEKEDDGVDGGFENAHGHSMRGGTNYWVTSGVGTWVPRVRTSGRTEIVSIDLVPR
jgi:hypothetical protein